MQQQEALFEANCKPVLSEVQATFEERGIQYADTWRNSQFLALKAALRLIGHKTFLDDEDRRTIAAAVLVDVKYARLEGGWKEDTAIDLIAYTANFIAQMRKIDARQEVL